MRPALSVSGKGYSTFHDFTYAGGVSSEKDMSAYLMVFHHDDTHGLHMAVSRDGYTFTTLNGGRPVIAGDTIADQRGIRAPHIYRGPDGVFYLAMTDLHICLKKHNFGFVETSDFETFTPIGRFNEGRMKATNFSSPKHGAVVHITAEEADRLERFWKTGRP